MWPTIRECLAWIRFHVERLSPSAERADLVTPASTARLGALLFDVGQAWHRRIGPSLTMEKHSYG